MSNSKPEIRIISYMCPTHPVELYELIMELFEASLDCYATLQYESRSPGPIPGRPDPFVTDKADLGWLYVFYCYMNCELSLLILYADIQVTRKIKGEDPIPIVDIKKNTFVNQATKAFMTAAAYMKLREENNEFVELLPVTPVFAHQMNVENKPGYFSDIIIHIDKKAHNVNTLLDLRGSTFAYSDEGSLSGSKIVLKTLKEKGENASFFGSLLRSGSHLASAQMVLTKQAEWAAVDSTTLLYSKKYMQDGGKEIVTLETLGRLPPYPIVVNSRLTAEIKKEITKTLLSLPHTGEWKKRFAKFGIIKFDENTDGAYNGPAAQMWSIQSEKLNIRYY